MFSVTNQSQSRPQSGMYPPQSFNRDLTMNFVPRSAQSSYKNPSQMGMNVMSRPQYQEPSQQQRPNHIGNLRDAIREQAVPNENNRPKMLWGRFTWILLHTMAEQIREERFHQLRNEIMHFIYTVCINLPCPLCTEHAKEYLSKNNILQSQTKEELKYALFMFHNTVNQRKDYQQFTLEQLNDTYSKAIPRVVFQNFLVHFNSKSKSIKLIADELHRQNVSQNLKSWFEIHINDFYDPSRPSSSDPIPSSLF